MSNNGKSLTNVSFRAKMLEVIDKLKDQDKTALVRHVDDFEALNKDTFEAGMNALVEAIPEGGGGGGGGGDSSFFVKFTVNQEGEIDVNKTLAEIKEKAAAGEAISGAFYVSMPFPEEPSVSMTLYVPLTYSEQIVKLGEEEFAEFTLVRFYGDKMYASMLFDSMPIGPDETSYFQSLIQFTGSVEDGNDVWTFDIIEIGEEKTVEDDPIANWPLSIRLYPDNSFNPMNPGEPYWAYVDHSNHGAGWGVQDQDIQNPNVLTIPDIYKNFGRIKDYMSYFAVDGYKDTVGQDPDTGNSLYVRKWNKPMQMLIRMYDDNSAAHLKEGTGIYTLNKVYGNFSANHWMNSGYFEYIMDENDITNNKIIRYIVRFIAEPKGNHVYYYVKHYKTEIASTISEIVPIVT